ncbi:5'-3' exonuclease PLD3 isoform X1 [Fundulus heteroclitus]|uniref:5'-3' exonuclease PLD3 isoform X1 n=2 Tax=Fundulus heteroclitus TaxID=8078 RepID=UPI00165BA26C|nr:5'-3' exonuclease PLD3 isoform X1 [Fundulus heteroclitus]
MPMVLRTRRSLVPDGPSAEVEFQPTQRRRRRSNRRQQRQNYEEEAGETEESVPEEVMERYEAELEEEAAEEADLTELKDCSVVLDRLQVDEGAPRKELEEKEDMNRKGGKPVSRIPTFQKRPGGPTVELPAPRREAQPSERGGGGGAEGFKHKLPESREGALPPPSVRVPAGCFVTASVSGGVEQAAAAAAAGHTSEVPAPRSKSQSEPAEGLLMVASPRPPLRPEQDPSRTPRTEAGSTPDGPPSSLPQESSLSQKAGEERAEIVLDASGDGERTEEPADAAEVGRVEAIMDEEPPWETEAVETAELRASACSSDAECDDDLPSEASEGHDSQSDGEDEEWIQQETELPEPGENKPAVDDCTSSVVEEKSARENPTKATKRSTRSGSSLLLLLPLLLLGGLGLHVWRYGLPTSAAQLAAQLELQRLEGLAFMPEPCGGDCRVQLVESVPVGLYPSSPPSGPSVADGWLRLLGRANASVHIAAFYFTLRDGASSDPPDSQGREVFEQLKRLEAKGVKLQIAVNAPQRSRQDTADLAATGAQVREVDLNAVTGGIVHTKLWVVDQKHFYVGSANMDWRSLSQVKEVGLTVEDCSCLAQDAFRIFGVYWTVGGGAAGGSLPPFWPARLSALSSADKPLHLKFNGVPARVYLSVSGRYTQEPRLAGLSLSGVFVRTQRPICLSPQSAPPPISARGRSDDLATILSVIDDAQRSIHISVMDYLPMSQYTKPERFWPAIDSRLRAAACTRGVEVRLMVSCWEHSPASMFPFLQSLLVLRRPPLKCNIDVKVFTVPSTAEQQEIPFARVNHAKYMVTDRVLYIGTSNWSENYFTHTAGVGLVVNQTGSAVEEGQRTLQSQAEELFLRDWTSDYASALPLDEEDVCPSAKREPF